MMQMSLEKITSGMKSVICERAGSHSPGKRIAVGWFLHGHGKEATLGTIGTRGGVLIASALLVRLHKAEVGEEGEMKKCPRQPGRWHLSLHAIFSG